MPSVYIPSVWWGVVAENSFFRFLHRTTSSKIIGKIGGVVWGAEVVVPGLNAMAEADSFDYLIVIRTTPEQVRNLNGNA
jgi:hypothetical protein